jgi:hypothetical protein
MTYNIELDHNLFILLLDTLKKAQDGNIINWSATDMVCEHTKVSYE